ncbi:MAG: DUF2905 domain-containing protein [Myxococcota bacterium]
MADMGRMLLMVGAMIALVGVFFLFADKLHLPRLPGDVTIKRDGFTFHFPLATSIVVSIVLTLLVNLFLRGR